MACAKSLDFAGPSGAHLSFYWTMDEAAAANKLDSTVGLAWPLIHGAVAGVGLFSNGTNCDCPTVLNFHRGVGMSSNGSVVINQAVSKGISVWFWMKIVTFGTPGEGIVFNMDTSDPLHTNRFRILGGSVAGATSFEVGHTNDTDDVFADTPNVPWNLGDWHMVAATYDKVAHTINCYTDGVLTATAPDAFTYPDLTTTDMELSNTSQPGTLLDIIVDEFGICLNGALTQTQVTALWNGGAGMTWPAVTGVVPYP